MYHLIGVSGGFITDQFSQLKDIGLDKIGFKLECFTHQITGFVYNQTASGFLDGLDQFDKVYKRESGRNRTGDYKNIVVVQVVLNALEEAQEIAIGDLETGFVDLGVIAVEIDDLYVHTGIAGNIDEIVVNIDRSQRVLHGTTVGTGAEAEGDAFAAECLDSTGDVDALTAGFDRGAGRTVELIGLQWMFDAQGTVHCGIERDSNDHEGFLLRTQS